MTTAVGGSDGRARAESRGGATSNLDFLPLAYPLAYALHLVEEIGAGEGFVQWIGQHFAPSLSSERFIAINGITWPAMLIASLILLRSGRLRWLFVALAVIVLTNAVLHLGSSAIASSYSPGTVTATLLYLPLGIHTLRTRAMGLPRGEILTGALLGLAVHALVVLAAAGFSTP